MIIHFVLVHHKMQLRIRFMDCKCSIFSTVISDAIFLLRILQAQDVGDGSFIEPNVTLIFKCPCLFVVIEPPFPITCIVLGVLWMLLRSFLLQNMSHVDWLSISIKRWIFLVGWAWVLNENQYCAAHTLSIPDSLSVLLFLLANWTDFFFEGIFFPDLSSTIFLSFLFLSSLSIISSVQWVLMCPFLPQLWQTAFFFHSAVLRAVLEFPCWENATPETSGSDVLGVQELCSFISW